MKIILVGAGRIGFHLGKRFRSKGMRIAQVLNRSAGRAEALAERLDCSWSDRWEDVLPDADWIVVAVRDDAIKEVAAALKPYVAPEVLITHTSGATSGKVLADDYEHYGVFYPLQTFSMERTPVWSKIPFCVDAGTEEDLLFLKKTAKRLGNLVYEVNDEQRAQLHVAAVFANNFTNHCYAIAEKIAEKTGLSFDMLHPLMEETLLKALQESPAKMQTGPAIRGDQDTMESHLKLLTDNVEWQELYRKMSESIGKESGD